MFCFVFCSNLTKVAFNVLKCVLNVSDKFPEPNYTDNRAIIKKKKTVN